MSVLRAVAVVIAVAAHQAIAAEPPIAPLAVTGEAAERFLLDAEVVEISEFDTKGITRPRRATLSDGRLTARAVFKDVDELHEKLPAPGGRMLFMVNDRYQHEIAAYELDKLLGLGIVPPTVERRVDRDWGSLQLWVEGAMREWERKKVARLEPPDIEAWNNQISTVKVFLQLTWDADYNNISNLLVDEHWKLWKIDSSRAFVQLPELRREDSLTRFSRRLLAALESLDRTELEQAMRPWLSRRQIKALWARRTRILELAEDRVAEFGPEAVLYD